MGQREKMTSQSNVGSCADPNKPFVAADLLEVEKMKMKKVLLKGIKKIERESTLRCTDEQNRL